MMPMFMFEKLSGPQQRDAGTQHVKKPRGAIARLLDRITEVRLQQTEESINRARTRSGAIRSRVLR